VGQGDAQRLRTVPGIVLCWSQRKAGDKDQGLVPETVPVTVPGIVLYWSQRKAGDKDQGLVPETVPVTVPGISTVLESEESREQEAGSSGYADGNSAWWWNAGAGLGSLRSSQPLRVRAHRERLMKRR